MNQIIDPKAFDLDTAAISSPSDPDAPLKAMLAAQTQSLDALFADLVGEAKANLTKYPADAEAYARLALRTQWNCRASIEAMSKLRYRDALTARHGASLVPGEAEAPHSEPDAR